ncbi:hypothetical protein ABG067_003107 [Albugo candida]|uniref:MARVEL domain-containing protein n=1 Tax=Albugo candida TaxID=65357 RepID=A0A024GSH4_9STRA|nr:unnamed protein product [Albugo candida]|eukprot:CCI49865.1 unnamed protein product [Albugo candida]
MVDSFTPISSLLNLQFITMATYDTRRDYKQIIPRALQLILSALALAFAASASRRFINRRNGESAYLGSSELSFTLLVTYSTMLYALWHLFTEYHPITDRPRLSLVRLIDLIFLGFLFAAGLALVLSDYNRHCNGYQYLLHCGNIVASVVFTFLTMLPFLITLATSFTRTDRDKHVTGNDGYRATASPNMRSDANVPLSPVHQSGSTARTPAANV